MTHVAAPETNAESRKQAFDALRKPIACYVSEKTRKRLRRTQAHPNGGTLYADPWIFRDELTRLRGEEDSGRVCVVYGPKGEQIGVGLYDAVSDIAIRLFRDKKAHFGLDFLRSKFMSSIDLRSSIDRDKTNALRLVYGEQDDIPGLIVDQYADVLVVKAYSEAWIPYLSAISHELFKLLPVKAVVIRFARNTIHAAEQAGLAESQLIVGEYEEAVLTRVLYREDGLQYIADVTSGQKTGAFLDQRENRKRVRDISSQKRVLNVFSYTGGFSVSAAAGGATHVTSVDLSAPANRFAESIFDLNSDNQSVVGCEHRTITGDAFEVMEDLYGDRERFDIVIVDPPSFARKTEHIPQALNAYQKLANAGVYLVRPGGTLVFASCTSRVTMDDLIDILNRASAHLHRKIHIQSQWHHAADHPQTTRSGGYLKCIFAEVD